MELGRLVMTTYGENTEGFPALLNEVMWRSNYSYHPEYAVYALGVGHGVIDYTYKVHIPSHLVTQEKRLVALLGERVLRSIWQFKLWLIMPLPC